MKTTAQKFDLVRFAGIVLGIALLSICVGCESKSNASPSNAKSTSDETQYFVATTGHIADALSRITEGTDAEIKLFCGPGIDPHSFRASAGDVQAMESADAIFFNGFHLEAKLHDILHGEYEAKSWSMASAFPKEFRLDWVEDGDVDPDAPFDPHIWNHLPGWQKCVEGLISQLCKLDPVHEQLYRSNGEVYLAEMKATHEAALEKFKAIDPERRLLVSAHDAFNYFAKVYEFESLAVLGIGNDAEADVRTMREVAAKVSERKVPVIFLETITNRKITQALQEACEAKDWSVKIADQPLYSDDLGNEPPYDTFLGAFRSNVDLIAKSLEN